MTDDNLDLSRRKVLGALGTVGVASAGAGVGTSAFFSDTESYENNRLTAGELDLKVDWEEHYYDERSPGADEATPVPGNPNPADVDYYLPAIDNPDADPVALDFTNSQDALWDATAIEAFPDDDDDGRRDGSVSCADLTSVDDALASDRRTSDNGQDDGGDPLIQLEDVKPGDFGEVTFSLHLCDNPGYVWMQGELASASENGVTEPEGDDVDEDQQEGDADEPPLKEGESGEATVELLDEVRARMWYDENCDNQIETGTVDVMLLVDKSVSQNSEDQQALRDGLLEFVGGLPSGSQVGLLEFGGGDVDGFQGLDDPSDLDTSDVGTGPGGGNTPLPPALDIADQELRANGENEVQVIVAFTDGGPNYENETYSVDGGTYVAPRSSFPSYTGGGGGNDAQNDADPRPFGISDSELIETAEVAELVRDGAGDPDYDGTRIVTVDVEIPEGSTDPNVDTGAYLRNEVASSQAYAKDVVLDDLASVANDLAATAMEEDLFFEGSLREAMDALSAGNGIPLDGDTGTSFNEFSGTLPDIDGDGTDEFPESPGGGARDEDRECFAGGDTTHCVGFEWWLPVDHANQVQSDSAAFDLGFYTEQCRHNDGGGQNGVEQT